MFPAVLLKKDFEDNFQDGGENGGHVVERLLP